MKQERVLVLVQQPQEHVPVLMVLHIMQIGLVHRNMVRVNLRTLAH